MRGLGRKPGQGLELVAPITTRENAVSEQDAQQPAIETGAVREAGIQARISVSAVRPKTTKMPPPVC